MYLPKVNKKSLFPFDGKRCSLKKLKVNFGFITIKWS